MKAKKTSFIIVGIVVIVAVIAVIAFMLGRGTSVDGHAASSPSVPSETPTNAPEETSGEQENYPGAMIGNTQRTWPDPFDTYDDSAHVNPGTYSVDALWGNPVWTPVNHDGDFPETVKSGGWEQCQKADEIRLEGKTQQQYVNARYLVVNEQAGPTRLERGLPAGYAHSPQGAIVAALNVMGYGKFGERDEIGQEAEKRIWKTSQRVQSERAEWKQEPTLDFMRGRRAQSLPALTRYEVSTCTDNVVVVRVAMHLPDDPRLGIKYVVSEIPLIWRDGDWQPDFSGPADTRIEIESNTAADNFVEVEYS